MQKDSIRAKYEKFGVDGYYKNNADSYSNPHIDIIRDIITEKLTTDLKELKILDLCCGAGEITNIFILNNKNADIKGADPYTFEIYTKKTNKYCYPFSFKDIAAGKLTESFDVIICSFGLHLCERSLLPAVLWQLGGISKTLIILTPNKKPDCAKNGWFLSDEKIRDRVRLRIYKR